MLLHGCVCYDSLLPLCPVALPVSRRPSTRTGSSLLTYPWCDAQESFNVEAVFVQLAKQIKGKNTAPPPAQGSVLNQQPQGAKDGCAC